jgi:hypothetical protein
MVADTSSLTGSVRTWKSTVREPPGTVTDPGTTAAGVSLDSAITVAPRVTSFNVIVAALLSPLFNARCSSVTLETNSEEDGAVGDSTLCLEQLDTTHTIAIHS